LDTSDTILTTSAKMIKLSFSPLDLITGRDGKLVLTKLAAATFHALLALTVFAVTLVRVYRYARFGETPELFDIAMWTLYGGFAVGHAYADKTTAQINALKNRKLDMESPTPSTVTETTTTETRKAIE
jgi:hypothetical protein